MKSPSTERWESVRLGDVVIDRRDRLDPADDETGVYIGLEHLDPERASIARVGSPEDVSSQKSRFSATNVLFGKLRPYLRKVAFADRAGICSTDILVLEPVSETTLLPEFLYLLVSSERAISHAVACSAGTRMPRVSFDNLAELPVLLPSIEAQRRIAEIAFSLVTANEALAQELSSLRLTQRSLREEIIALDQVERLGDHLAGIEAGKSPTAADRPPRSDEIGVLKVSAVQQGKFVPEESKALETEVAFPERARVRRGDVLITRANTRALVGAACRVPGTFRTCSSVTRRSAYCQPRI